jgi:hypothetical protein
MGTTIRRPTTAAMEAAATSITVGMAAVVAMMSETGTMRTGAAGRAKAKGKATTVTVGAMTTEIRAYDRCRSNRA